MVDLRPDGLVELEYGVSVRSVGVAGTAGEVTPGSTAAAPVRDAEPDGLPAALAGEGVPGQGALVLGVAAEQAGMRRRLTVPLAELVAPPAPPPPAGQVRDAAAGPAVVVTVPAPEPGEGQALLEVDGTGVVRWHFAAPPDGAGHVGDGGGAGDGGDGGAGDGGVVRAGEAQVFRVPVEQFDLAEADGQRGLLAFGVRKVLHLVRFPVEWVAGQVAGTAVRLWEERHRPYGLHRASPAYFRGAGDPVGPDWFAGQSGGPVLLLVHGTFSVGRSAFAGLAADADLLARWSDAYAGRVLVFDHPSLHAAPADNVRRLTTLLPAGAIEIDVVAHSRGGLVARHLGAAAAATGGPAVRRLVHVATPNAGTVLASRGRLGDLLDMVTNLVSVFADEGSGTVAAGVLEVVKQLAVGASGGLPGLAAMDPDDGGLRALNAAPADAAVRLHAVTSDYRSTGGTLPARALDTLADALFGGANDLVVPTAGVYSAGAYRVAAPHDLSGRVPSVAHSGFFGEPAVRGALAEWLAG